LTGSSPSPSLQLRRTSTPQYKIRQHVFFT
jgi:hypothetical protein